MHKHEVMKNLLYIVCYKMLKLWIQIYIYIFRKKMDGFKP